jgi:hypothetical protein
MAESGGEKAHLLLLIIEAQMNAIKALIERMGQAPGEFVVEGSTQRTRWEHITQGIYDENNSKPLIFTQEEIDAYLAALSKIIRTQIEEQICIEILNPLRPDTPQQMELFPAQSGYPPGEKPITAKQITADALKILEDELYKNYKPKKLIL